MSSRRAARPSTPSTSTRAAANSIASGRPSSLRQISTTGLAFASVSVKSSTIAVTRSTNNCTAGELATSVAVSFDDGCGLPSGPRRYSLSPATRSGSLLVARILTPGAPPRTAAANLLAASMTCSQLSSTSSIRLSLRPPVRPCSGSVVPISSPSTVATALGTRRGSPRGARSTSQTLSSEPAIMRSATASARVVLPIPPGPTIVTKR